MVTVRVATAVVLLGLWLTGLPPAAKAVVDACCFGDGSCQSIRTDECLAMGGEKVGSATCTPNPCPQPEGGTCVDTSQCQEGLQCVEEACRAMSMAPAASGAGLLFLAGGLALLGGFAARRRIAN